uniref:Cap-13 n=1 Tax=Haemonchus contortus TaxID=6289 RepID=A0A0K2DSH8_HAECO|nr:cap-13 [Haemonchus contortus]
MVHGRTESCTMRSDHFRELASKKLLFSFFGATGGQETTTTAAGSTTTTAAGSTTTTAAGGGAANGTSSTNGTAAGNGTANSTAAPVTTTTITTTTSTINGSEPANCDSTQLSSTIRQRFLDRHNELRGSLARGQGERNGAGGLAPPAANMYRMRYTCQAESFAQTHVNSCNDQVIPPEDRLSHKENVYRFEGGGGPADAAEAAMNNWWSQLANYGVPSNMQFTQQLRNRPVSNAITKWSKMAWWNNLQVGCAINQCDGFQLVVCMYSPGGNDVDKPIYNVGAPCSQCPGQCFDGLCSQ